MRSASLSTEETVSPFRGMDAFSLLRHGAGRHPDRPLLIWSPLHAPERIWSYAAFVADVERVAGGLHARGIGPGDRVMVHLENCPEALVVRFACALIRAVCVATNAMATGPELAAMASATGVRAAVTQPCFAALFEEHVRGLDWIALTSTDAGEPPPQGSRPQDRDSLDAFAGELPARAPRLDDPALILFTTGTTARPKAVVWTHENLLWASRLGAQQQEIAPGDVIHLFLPLFHVVGFSWTFLPALWAGASVLLQPRFSASRFWSAAISHRATHCAHVPFTLAALQGGEIPGRHHFRQWTVNRQVAAVRQAFAIPRLVSAWGMTEMVAQPIIGHSDGPGCPEGSMGRPSLGYGVRIADGEGRSVGAGEEGELLVRGLRGRSIFRDYLGDEDATNAAFDADGWFRTGDRVRLSEEGAILFLDRLKDVIKVGGEGVSAAEIEAVVLKVAGVAEVAVVAGPDPLRGEIPVAFVVLEAGRAHEERARIMQAIGEECRQCLAKFKMPQEIRFLERLPRVGFGKIAKAELRSLVNGG